MLTKLARRFTDVTGGQADDPPPSDAPRDASDGSVHRGPRLVYRVNCGTLELGGSLALPTARRRCPRHAARSRKGNPHCQTLARHAVGTAARLGHPLLRRPVDLAHVGAHY